MLWKWCLLLLLYVALLVLVLLCCGPIVLPQVVSHPRDRERVLNDGQRRYWKNLSWWICWWKNSIVIPTISIFFYKLVPIFWKIIHISYQNQGRNGVDFSTPKDSKTSRKIAFTFWLMKVAIHNYQTDPSLVAIWSHRLTCVNYHPFRITCTSIHCS